MAECSDKNNATECSSDEKKDKQNGICRIKPEFILKDRVKKLAEEWWPEDEEIGYSFSNSDEVLIEPPWKKIRREKRALRGHIQHRPPPFKVPTKQNLCPWMVDRAKGEPAKQCRYKTNCTFMHDRAAYMRIKADDIGPECYVFNISGKCHSGVACRAGAKHLTENGYNIVDTEKYAEYKKKPAAIKNYTRREFRDRLRKGMYNFSEVDEILKVNNPWRIKNASNEKTGTNERSSTIVGNGVETEQNDSNAKDEDASINGGKGEELSVPNSRNDDLIPSTECSSNAKDEDASTDGAKVDELSGPNSRNDDPIPSTESNSKASTNGAKVDELSGSNSRNVDPTQSTEISSNVKDEDVSTNGAEVDQLSGSNSRNDDSTPSLENTAKIESMDVSSVEEESRIGPVPDHDIIALRSSEKKKIEWRDKIILSPLATVGNLPFRRICKEYGADVTCAEMILAKKILKGAHKEWSFVQRHETEDIFGAQVCCHDVDALAHCAHVLNREVDVDYIELDLGCPIDLAYPQSGRCWALNDRSTLQAVIKAMNDVINVPLTIKTRTGNTVVTPSAHNLLPKFRDWGASMITLHGRSRQQRFTESADWEYIEKCAKAADPMPVFGNGDILSYDDYARVRDKYKTIQGVTIGRGALIKPWIFTEIKEKKLLDVRSNERFDILRKYVNYGLEHWGSNTRGVEMTRRFMLEWLSFSHRYIPVGILENPPQRINEKPPYYSGRDEMETMMASSDCADWIKISEMLLGKVPAGFKFAPTYIANSWM